MEAQLQEFENLKMVPLINKMSSSIEKDEIPFPIKKYFKQIRNKAKKNEGLFFLKYHATMRHFEAIDLLENETLKKLDRTYKTLVAIPMSDDTLWYGEVEVIKRLKNLHSIWNDSDNIFEIRINFSNKFFKKEPNDGEIIPEFYLRFFFFLDSTNDKKLIFEYLDKTGKYKTVTNKETNEKGNSGLAVKQWYNECVENFEDYLEEVFEYDRYD